MKKTAVSDDEPIVWLSTNETATLLGVPLRTLYRLIDEQQIPAYKFGRVIRLQQHHVTDYRDWQPKPVRHDITDKY